MALTERARSGTWPLTTVVLVVLGVLPLMSISPRMLSVLILAIIYGIAVVGLDLFSGYSGQLTFGNFAFVAIGSYMSAMLTTEAGWSVWATLPASILVCMLIGAFLALPMVRLPGLGGALVTFFFGFVVVVLLNGHTLYRWTKGADGIAVTPLEMGGTDFTSGQPLYYLSFVSLVVVVLLSNRYANSRAGRALRVVKRGEILAASMGISVRTAKISSFAFSAGTAGLAGWLFAQALGYLSPESFPEAESVTLVAMAVVGGLGSIGGPIIGAVFFEVISELSRGAGQSRDLIFAALLVAALVVLPQGIFGALDDTIKRIIGPAFRRTRVGEMVFRRRSAGTKPPAEAAADASAHQLGLNVEHPVDHSTLLQVSNVSVRFGGLKALSDVNLSVKQGSVHAIVGPNGAGKTTLLNCISGIQPCDGEIALASQTLNGKLPAEIRRSGVSRTFQHPAIVGDLTAEENVVCGTYGLEPSFPYWDLVPLPHTIARDRDALRKAEYALDLVQFPKERRTVLGSELSLAEQKVVDIARAVAGPSKLLLLDEPTAGLSEEDIDRIVNVLRTLSAQTGITIVVIAHHVGFLAAVATEATVLNFGAVLADGPIGEVMEREEVIEVFLGVSHERTVAFDS